MKRRPLGKVLVAAGGALLKSLLQSAVVVGASALAWQINPAVGSLVALVGSFVLVARSYRKEWRLLWITVLLPPLGMGLSYGVQLGRLGQQPNPALLLAAIVVGLVLGWLRGRAHEVFVKGRQIFAQRTVSYLSIWALCFCGTQAFALARQQQLIEYGMLGGAFSTAILAAVALVLLSRYHRKKQELLLAGALTVGIGFLVLPALVALAAWPGTARAQGSVGDSSTALNISGTWETFRHKRRYYSHSGPASSPKYKQEVLWSQGYFIVFTQQGSSVEGVFFFSDWWLSGAAPAPAPSDTHLLGKIRMRGVLQGNQLSGEHWGDPGSGDFTFKFTRKGGKLRFTGSWTPGQPQEQTTCTWTGERMANPLVNTLVPVLVPPSHDFLKPAVEVAIASAVIMILIALGVNTAQAIAGVAPVTVEAVTRSVVQELGGTGDQRPRVKRPQLPVRQPPPLFDPDDVDGKPLTVNEGKWPEVPVGHVWYGGEWVDRATAKRWIADRQRQIARRQAEGERHQRLTSEMMDREREKRRDRLQREGFVYDQHNDEWRPGEHHPETIARRRSEERVKLVEFIEKNVSDLDRADFLKGFVQRTADDGADMSRIRNVVREVTQGAHMQEAAVHYNRAEEFGAWEKTSEEIRDWSMRVNRIGLLIASGGGGSLVMAQGMTYGTIEGYAQGGFSGAATTTVVGIIDMFTGGAGSAAVRAGQAELKDGESRWSRWASEWGTSINEQYNPARILERGLNAKTWGELVDAGLDMHDLGQDAVDSVNRGSELVNRGRELWDHVTGDSDSGRATAPDDIPRVSDGESPGTGPSHEHGDGFDGADPSSSRRDIEPSGARVPDDVGPQGLDPDGGGGRTLDDGVLDPNAPRPAGSDDVGPTDLDPYGGGDPPGGGGKGPGPGDDVNRLSNDGSDTLPPPVLDPEGSGDRPDDEGGPPDVHRDEGDRDRERNGDDDGGDQRDGDGDGDGGGNGNGDGARDADADAEWQRAMDKRAESRQEVRTTAEEVGKTPRTVKKNFQESQFWREPAHPGIKPSEDVFERLPPPHDSVRWSPEDDSGNPRINEIPDVDYIDPATIPDNPTPADHFYGADENGRLTRASGWLTLGGGTSAEGEGFSGLERGHLIPNAGGGDGRYWVPMTPEMNNSHVRSIEKLALDVLRNDTSNNRLRVKLDVEVRYEPGYEGRMPREVIHHLTIVDSKTGQVIKNLSTGGTSCSDGPVWGKGVFDGPRTGDATDLPPERMSDYRPDKESK
ncbi:MAG: DUF2339 domain-containing protein [bacterium]|nr:DUF2339 domain-containing protein [bacterium]